MAARVKPEVIFTDDEQTTVEGWVMRPMRHRRIPDGSVLVLCRASWLTG